MMKRWQKMLVGISVSILFFVLCVGYAAVNDDLNIFGFLNMEGQNKAVLVAGPEFNEALQVCDGVKTVIFDTFTNQSTAMQSMNMEWEAGTAVDEEAKGDIRLFYHAASSTAYILIQTDGDILANPDASGMFENIATLETIWFNRFSTKATTEFDSMFAGCGSLKTIYAATDFEVTALVSADNMFTECYILTGGKGTRVYPLGATATDQPLDATNAKIDAVGTPGYFTNVSQLRLTYFHSNLLKETSAEYSVKGSSVEITLSNGLDTRKIQYVGGRTYNVSVDVSSSLTSTESAYRRTVAKSGYMTVEQTGWYILELWGGDGGDGKTSELNLAPDGEGGRGGYVYGKVYLKAGQTLAYSIGTDGTQSLTNEDGSGGANGSGGTHGDSGSVYVGGGGGFSALFLFDEGEFNPGWFNDKATGNNVWTMMPEDVRLSRYLMIAGGGGGGGAAPWITGLLGWAINGEVYAPNGGYGGRISSSYITLSGSQYDVEGYPVENRGKCEARR